MFKLDFTIFQKYYKFRFLYCILAEESRNYFFQKKFREFRKNIVETDR